MALDFVCCERQFIDHAAPIWHALSERGRFVTESALVPHAASLGIAAEGAPGSALRWGAPPRANPGDGPTAFVVSIGDTKVARRLGYRRFVFMEHGAGQAYIGQSGISGRHPSYAGGMDREDTGLFLVPNHYSADLWRKAYPAAAVEVIGCPRLDTLPAREPGEPTVAITFHWPAYVCDESGTALGTYGPALADLAKRFRVIGTSHPKGDWPVQMARVYRRAGIEFVPDFAEVCRRADVLAFDNTSAGFEFAATGRPVVVMNDPKYRRSVHHGLRFWDASEVGVNVERAADLGGAIAEALEDAPARRTAREDALRIVYAYRHGAAERGAGAVLAWLRATEAVAA